jgi:hypothetical protein
MDPTEKPEPQVDNHGGGSSAMNTASIQLTAGQIEEAKEMTVNKMKRYRRDRIIVNDKDRIEFL